MSKSFDINEERTYHSITSKILPLVALISCTMLLNATTVKAEDAIIPTLDKLNQAGTINPATIKTDENGNITDTGSVYPKSAYSLKKVDFPNKYTITTYAFDYKTQKLIPQYYEIDLKTLEYGTINTDKNKTNTYSVHVTDEGTIDITYKYDIPETAYKITDENHIQGDFLNMIYKDDDYANAFANDIVSGPLRNLVTTKNIDGNFVQNGAEATGKNIVAGGGAILNINSVLGTSEIGDITGHFIENHATSEDGMVRGGAIYNSQGIIGHITGDFIGNYAITNAIINGMDSNIINGGGAIYNDGTVGNISGNFINNYTKSQTHDGVAGAIFNIGTVGDISGNFIENNATSEKNRAYGGAIANQIIMSEDNQILQQGVIGNITGNFLGNKVYAALDYGFGGAIYNANTISYIVGDFIENEVHSTDNALAYGGAIANKGIVSHITGDFIGNSTSSESGVSAGGAILVFTGKTGDITGNFYENSATSTEMTANGGAILNQESTIGNITGDFVSNFVEAPIMAYGGAICNALGEIGDITGNFYGNFAKSETENGIANGGAIYNLLSSSIGNITGNFIENEVVASDIGAGGAINNSLGEIKNISGNFIYNSATAGNSVDGGAIYNSGTIADIEGSFIKNEVISTASDSSANGGAIYNSGELGNIEGNFLYNGATSGGNVSGGVIYNSGEIKDIQGAFIDNYTKANDANYGGIIFNSGSIENIKGDFKENSISSSAVYGGAIYNSGEIKSIESDFIDNSVKASSINGGIIYNSGVIQNITGNFKNITTSGSGSAYGGVIFNAGTIGKVEDDGRITGGLVNTSFIGNSVTGKTEALGGAIYTTKDINIISDGGIVEFKDNYTLSGAKKDDNAIYVGDANATVNFELKNGGQIRMRDNIDGTYEDTPTPISLDNEDLTTRSDKNATTPSGGNLSSIKSYSVNITGDDINNTQFYMFNDMRMADLTVSDTTINTINNQVHVYNLNNFTLNGDTKFTADVDLANQTMDRFTAKGYGEHQGNLKVSGMNLVSDAPENTNLIEIYFAQSGLKNNVVKSFTDELPHDSHQTTLYTPIYKYNVDYENREDAGYFVFRRGSGTGSSNGSDIFNPSVLTSPVAAQAGAQITMNETYEYVFEHLDAFTQNPAKERDILIASNKFAIGSTDFNDNSLYDTHNHYNKAFWLRPYTSFENMHLKNGPRADVISYGTLIGFDTDFRKLKRGWANVGTGYIGYNGSRITYGGTSTTMNGGLLGFTETFYKKNFWTAVTLSAGTSVGETHNMYGKEDFTSFLAGVASKTGYNLEIKDGRYIIQPIWFMSYTFVNTFDYTNSAGVKISNDPMHTIQLYPNLRFIMNTKSKWQPYASVGMVWNLLNETHTMANNVKLPEMRMKPYVEYGLGVQRHWKDNFCAFGQAMLRNGGRNGIALTFGFRWSLGKSKEKTDIQKVKTPAVIKTATK